MLLSYALQILHFKCFMSEYGPQPPHFIEQLKILHDEPSPFVLDKSELWEAYDEIIQKCSEFLETSRSGYHGSTAKYWITHIDLIQ